MIKRYTNTVYHFLNCRGVKWMTERGIDRQTDRQTDRLDAKK